MNTVMIISGESSGELYGSLLARTLRKRWSGVRIIGVGGERMKEAGVELVSYISDAFGLTEAVSAFNKIKIAFDNSINALKNCRPAVLVLIDYPDFNLRVAKKAKSLGIKILYYVSPQVWAWRRGRVKKIAALVDKMAVILPFEEKIYRNAGLECEFVGHPILEEIESVMAEGLALFGNPLESQTSLSPSLVRLSPEIRYHFKVLLGLTPDQPLLSFLPGSRPSELRRHLPMMADVVRQIKSDPKIFSGRNFRIIMPLAPNTDEGKYAAYFDALRREGVAIRKGETVKVLAASDAAVVASGTATLQTAFLGVPMVVVYKLSPLTYHLGKRIIRVKYISLVNILSGREVVAELIQQRANPKAIINELGKITSGPSYREDMLDAFGKIKEHFSGQRASDRVAEIIMEMAGRVKG